MQKLLTFKSGGLAIVIYAFSLIITLITTRMDDYLSLYEHNATLFNFEDEVKRDNPIFSESQSTLTTYLPPVDLCEKIPSLLKGKICILTLIFDLFSIYLSRLST